MKATAASLPARIQRLAAVIGSQNKLADFIGVSGPTITGWMGGSAPYQRTLMNIAERMGVSLEWLRDGQGDEEAELAKFAERMSAGRVGEDPLGYGPAVAFPIAKMESPAPHCRRVIEHITQHLSTEHFTEAQLRVMQDTTISPGERERIAQHMAAILADRLSAKQNQRQTKN